MGIDDVHSVDEHGVPRRADGQPAEIVEYSNTPSEAVAEVKILAEFNPLRMPGAAWRFMFNKATCHRTVLADYGDTPHIYRIVEKSSEEERNRIVEEAVKYTKDYE